MMHIDVVFYDHNDTKQESSANCKEDNLALMLYTIVKAHQNLNHSIISIKVIDHES